MSDPETKKDEGLIKDSIELILRELQTVLTVFYLLLVGIGMLFTHKKYAAFDINIFEYADIFDFLIAPFQDFLIISVTLGMMVFPAIGIIFDIWWSKRFPKTYSKFNFGWDKKSWFNVYRSITFLLLLLIFLFEGANAYGRFQDKRIHNEPKVDIVFADGSNLEGYEIGKTAEVMFLLVDEKVRVIPLTSLVKEIRLNSGK